MRGSHVVALDEGTSGVSAVVFDARGRKRGRSYREIPQFFPRPGWVEHDAEAIWRASLTVLRGALRAAKVSSNQVACLGITNQRETLVAWDARSGRALSRAIVWQCRRTADLCGELKADGSEAWVRERTGLLIDPYFSGSKLRWMVEHVPKVQSARRDGRLRFGTIDSWLVHRLTGGRDHLTDATNASRTLLMDLGRQAWDPELLDLFKARAEELPTIVDSAGALAVAEASVLGREVPVAGIAGDQQAALFGQVCFEPGQTKNTYGTGCFALANAGGRRPRPPQGILSTLAWRLEGRPTYALEGAVFVAGAVVQWLRDGLGFFRHSADSESLARSVPDDGGVVVVPAFTGLGAPYWDAYARASLHGLTRGTTKAHITRAALQSIALQSAEIVEILAKGASTDVPVLRVDGGATENGLLMQYQADILGRPVERARYAETTALGAAYLAGLGAGVWSGLDELSSLWSAGKRWVPRRGEAWREAQWRRWREAVSRSRSWANSVT